MGSVAFLIHVGFLWLFALPGGAEEVCLTRIAVHTKGTLRFVYLDGEDLSPGVSRGHELRFSVGLTPGKHVIAYQVMQDGGSRGTAVSVDAETGAKAEPLFRSGVTPGLRITTDAPFLRIYTHRVHPSPKYTAVDMDDSSWATSTNCGDSIDGAKWVWKGSCSGGPRISWVRATFLVKGSHTAKTTECDSASANCERCSSGKCVKCKKGYWKPIDGCVVNPACPLIPHCRNCPSPTRCETCSSAAFVPPDCQLGSTWKARLAKLEPVPAEITPKVVIGVLTTYSREPRWKSVRQHWTRRLHPDHLKQVELLFFSDRPHKDPDVIDTGCEALKSTLGCKDGFIHNYIRARYPHTNWHFRTCDDVFVHIPNVLVLVDQLERAYPSRAEKPVPFMLGNRGCYWDSAEYADGGAGWIMNIAFVNGLGTTDEWEKQVRFHAREDDLLMGEWAGVRKLRISHHPGLTRNMDNLGTGGNDAWPHSSLPVAIHIGKEPPDQADKTMERLAKTFLKPRYLLVPWKPWDAGLVQCNCDWRGRHCGSQHPASPPKRPSSPRGGICDERGNNCFDKPVGQGPLYYKYNQ